VNVQLWGTRGSIPAPRPETAGYGGNTSCVEVRGDTSSHLVILDAGTGICSIGAAGLPPEIERVDILLTHLHMDHILGLGFFQGLFKPGLEVHVWGPASPRQNLRDRLGRYLSPPLFPVRIRELPCRLTLHDVPLGTFEIPGFSVRAALICHPGPTVGYRLENGRGSLSYLPDHEPALGARQFPERPEWTSGYDLVAGCDVLIHDAQYDDEEYRTKVGWGHSSVTDTYAFASAAGVHHLVPFHHDPRHNDSVLDALFDTTKRDDPPFGVTVAREGVILTVGTEPPADQPVAITPRHPRHENPGR
jgi:ribonuclease BN (tRNA processing enzyme)